MHTFIYAYRVLGRRHWIQRRQRRAIMTSEDLCKRPIFPHKICKALTLWNIPQDKLQSSPRHFCVDQLDGKLVLTSWPSYQAYLADKFTSTILTLPRNSGWFHWVYDWWYHYLSPPHMCSLGPTFYSVFPFFPPFIWNSSYSVVNTVVLAIRSGILCGGLCSGSSLRSWFVVEDRCPWWIGWCLGSCELDSRCAKQFTTPKI